LAQAEEKADSRILSQACCRSQGKKVFHPLQHFLTAGLALRIQDILHLPFHQSSAIFLIDAFILISHIYDDKRTNIFYFLRN
jgi:hypothetical protein